MNINSRTKAIESMEVKAIEKNAISLHIVLTNNEDRVLLTDFYNEPINKWKSRERFYSENLFVYYRYSTRAIETTWVLRYEYARNHVVSFELTAEEIDIIKKKISEFENEALNIFLKGAN